MHTDHLYQFASKSVHLVLGDTMHMSAMSVCLSVRPSVCHVHCMKMSKHILKLFHHLLAQGNTIILR